MNPVTGPSDDRPGGGGGSSPVAPETGGGGRLESDGTLSVRDLSAADAPEDLSVLYVKNLCRSADSGEAVGNHTQWVATSFTIRRMGEYEKS